MKSPELALIPWAGLLPGHKPATLKAVPVDGLVGIGLAVPGRSDLGGGLVNPTELMAFARELLALASRMHLEAWQGVVIPSTNGKHKEGG